MNTTPKPPARPKVRLPNTPQQRRRVARAIINAYLEWREQKYGKKKTKRKPNKKDLP